MVLVTVSFKDFSGFPLYHKNKPFKSLNHLISHIHLVFHLGVMGCEKCTMMRKQLTSTPVVDVYYTQEVPAGAITVFHSMVSTKELLEVS